MQIVADHTTVVHGTKHFFAGAWWGARLKTTAAEVGLPKSDIGVSLCATLPPGVVRAASGLVGSAAVGSLIHYELAVASVSGAGQEPAWDSMSKAAATPFRFTRNPSGEDIWGWPSFLFKVAMPDGSPIHRSNFRSAASPILRGGKMRVRVTVNFL